jgi:hypothetical protein
MSWMLFQIAGIAAVILTLVAESSRRRRALHCSGPVSGAIRPIDYQKERRYHVSGGKLPDGCARLDAARLPVAGVRSARTRFLPPTPSMVRRMFFQNRFYWSES